MSYIDQLERELVRAGQPRPRRMPRVTLGGLTMAGAVALSLALAVLALAALRHKPAPAPQAAATPTPASARSLVSQLAVLRRPQTPADLSLPAPRKVGALIPGLTRLAVDTKALKVWVLVIPAGQGGPHAQWPPRFGDLVALQARVDGRTYTTAAVPAGGLRDPGLARNVGGWIVQLVPDRVVRAQFTVPVKTGTYSVSGSVVSNIAFAHLGAVVAPLRPAKWYAADGRPVPTTPRMVSEQIKQRQAKLDAQLAAGKDHHPIPAAMAQVLPRPASGPVAVTIPGLTGLPAGILKMAVSDPARIDPSHTVEVTADGVTFWVAPGQRGLCLFGLDSARAGFSVCSPSLASALTDGVSTGLRSASGRDMRVAVVPRRYRTVTFALKAGGTRTVRVIDGLVITPDAGITGPGRPA